jgi:hypothetical protein
MAKIHCTFSCSSKGVSPQNIYLYKGRYLHGTCLLVGDLEKNNVKIYLNTPSVSLKHHDLVLVFGLSILVF